MELEGRGQEQANLALRRFFGRGTDPKRLEMAVGFIWVNSRGLATILDPFRTILDDLGPDGLSETSTSVLSQQLTSVLSQQQTSALSQQQTSVLSQPVLARTGKLIDVR